MPKGEPYLKTPDNCTKKHWTKKHYCWTHSLSNHTNNECFYKAEEYEDSGTIKNKIGGLKVYCSWRYESGYGLVINKINKFYVSKPKDSCHTLNDAVIAKGDSRATHNY